MILVVFRPAEKDSLTVMTHLRYLVRVTVQSSPVFNCKTVTTLVAVNKKPNAKDGLRVYARHVILISILILYSVIHHAAGGPAVTKEELR